MYVLCALSNDIQCTQVVPPEAEKHSFDTFLAYHLPEANSMCYTHVQTEANICTVIHCPPTCTHKNFKCYNYTSCVLINVKGLGIGELFFSLI